MLTIRMQRTGRKGHAMFRVVVQDARLTPTSGKVVAQLGSYDPHAKVAGLDTERAAFYLNHGAQPSSRVARLLQQEGIALPKWVQLSENKTRSLRNPEKLRKNQKESTKSEQPTAADQTPDDTAETTEEA